MANINDHWPVNGITTVTEKDFIDALQAWQMGKVGLQSDWVVIELSLCSYYRYVKGVLTMSYLLVLCAIAVVGLYHVLKDLHGFRCSVMRPIVVLCFWLISLMCRKFSKRGSYLFTIFDKFAIFFSQYVATKSNRRAIYTELASLLTYSY